MADDFSKAASAPAGGRPTAYDVARLAGVSQSLVSRTFTPGASVSAEARAKVMAVARQLGYRPNLIARSLITQQSRLVAVAMAYMDNQFYPAILQALSEAFSEAGYRLLLFTPGPDGDPDPILDEVLRFQVAAVILASTRLTSHFVAECSQARVPVVLLNRRTADDTVSSVTGENVAGGRAIGAFLLAGGHRRLAYVAGLEDTSTSREREAGFRQALGEAGRDLSLRAVGHYDFAAAQAAARILFAAAERPDAIFCANDHTAFAVMETARSEFGLDIGRDVSVVGFDDVGLAAWPAYGLTTYSQPVEAMARRVVAVTLSQIGGGAVPIHETVSGALIVRSSARLPNRT